MKNIEMETTELQQILDSYNLSTPLDREFKKYAIGSMGKQFNKIMKKTGDYGFFSGVANSIFFFIRTNGIFLSI